MKDKILNNTENHKKNDISFIGNGGLGKHLLLSLKSAQQNVIPCIQSEELDLNLLFNERELNRDSDNGVIIHSSFREGYEKMYGSKVKD